MDEHWLITREETDAFKARHGVDTTPQTFIGSVGAISGIKAVYIDKHTLKCVCVGGNSQVPPGVVSLTEYLMMVAMAVWMLFGTT